MLRESCLHDADICEGVHSGWLKKVKSESAKVKWLSAAERRYVSLDFDNGLLFWSSSPGKKASRTIRFEDIYAAALSNDEDLVPKSVTRSVSRTLSGLLSRRPSVDLRQPSEADCAFAVQTKSRTLILIAGNPVDAACWVQAVNAACRMGRMRREDNENGHGPPGAGIGDVDEVRYSPMQAVHPWRAQPGETQESPGVSQEIPLTEIDGSSRASPCVAPQGAAPADGVACVESGPRTSGSSESSLQAKLAQWRARMREQEQERERRRPAKVPDPFDAVVASESKEDMWSLAATSRCKPDPQAGEKCHGDDALSSTVVGSADSEIQPLAMLPRSCADGEMADCGDKSASQLALSDNASRERGQTDPSSDRQTAAKSKLEEWRAKMREQERRNEEAKRQSQRDSSGTASLLVLPESSNTDDQVPISHIISATCGSTRPQSPAVPVTATCGDSSLQLWGVAHVPVHDDTVSASSSGSSLQVRAEPATDGSAAGHAGREDGETPVSPSAWALHGQREEQSGALPSSGDQEQSVAGHDAEQIFLEVLDEDPEQVDVTRPDTCAPAGGTIQGTMEISLRLQNQSLIQKQRRPPVPRPTCCAGLGHIFSLFR